jgi:uncharacterized protein
MKIRAVTSFYDPLLLSNPDLQDLSRCSHEITSILTSEGYVVQSQRVATSPFPHWLNKKNAKLTRFAIVQNLVEHTLQLGWQYLSIGPAYPAELEDYALIPELLTLAPTLFTSGVIASGRQLFPGAAAAAARVIVENSRLSTDGFTNLRFAALANVGPYAPFLPAAYSNPNEPPSMALAIECADEVVKAFGNAQTMENAKTNLLYQLESNAAAIKHLCDKVCLKHHVIFRGFDFSPASYPEELCSLGKALELLGIQSLGMSGSLAAAAFLASTLDLGKWKRCGFNGLMLPVLEDSTLARRAAEGTLTIKDLLLYSAVCGTGLDTIPLAGNSTSEQLIGVLLDLGALAVRLNKPLTGRLMPIPGKIAGDRTNFDFEFFANSRVMAIEAGKIGAPMAEATVFEINARKSYPDI